MMNVSDYVTYPFLNYLDPKLIDLSADFFQYKQIGLDERSTFVHITIECSPEGWQWYQQVTKEYNRV
ncbi:hypothetical protein [Spirosoma endbachense]|uniref:Uncharacterized protein n=1 Tax=Spirosoma endbachense TaxID=2666025 RepID=A0A6P1W0Q6_9BACT|nr:hypothetical protein [Spirosoma endbachense]QHV99011.1 hypothetical protein GJR95_30165 [Spirosoma endbachense]